MPAGGGIVLRLFGFGLTAAVACPVDLVSKWYVFSRLIPPSDPHRPLLPGILALSRHWNEGAVWGIGAGHDLLLLVLTAAILPAVILMAWAERETRAPLWALGLILGGAAGNLYDRALYGAVRDFLDLGWWPVFNLADSAIVVGVLVYTGWSLFHTRPATTTEAKTSSGEEGA